jgi:ferredoxin-NADP reductase
MSVALTNRKEVAAGTMSFYFETPRGFTFTAGQYVSLTLLDPPETDAKGSTRTFSIASAPEEAELMITTRTRDTAFKRCLETIRLGSRLTMEGPFGDLVLHSDPARAAIFLAGGIGITPFRSIAVSAARAKLPHRLFLFYSNHRPEDAAFLAELGKLQEMNSNYRLIATMTKLERRSGSWQGESGRIRKEMILRYVPNLARAIYYVAGPPSMALAMQDMLTEAGVSADDIRTEEFYGY